MTDPVIPVIPPAPVVPPYPALGAPNFNQMVYDVGTNMPGVVSGLNAIAAAARECALASKAYAQQVADSVGEANTASDTAARKAAEAVGSASDAAGSAGTATTASDAAMGYRNEANAAKNTATTQAGTATSKAGESAASAGNSLTYSQQSKTYRDQAEVFATQQLKGSSTTSVTPGAGAKSFAIEPSRSFVVGMYLVATSTGTPGTSMSGPVQSYDPATGALVLAVDTFSGAGARADWAIGVAAKGADSGLTRQEVTVNMTCVAGVAYIVAASGITLTLPTTWNAGDKIAVIEAIGDGLPYSLAFGSTKLRSRTMGTLQIDSAYGGTGVLTYHDATRGIV